MRRSRSCPARGRPKASDAHRDVDEGERRAAPRPSHGVQPAATPITDFDHSPPGQSSAATNPKRKSSMASDGTLVLGTSAGGPVASGRCCAGGGDRRASSGRSSKILADLYEECYPLSQHSSQARNVAPTGYVTGRAQTTGGPVRSNEAITLYGKVLCLSARRQSGRLISVSRSPNAVLRRSRSSMSRLSRLSQRSGVRESSDGMDNTDLSSETDHERDPECRKMPTDNQTNAHLHMDSDTLDKIQRWMKTLPPKFSRLCSVISVPDSSPGYGD